VEVLGLVLLESLVLAGFLLSISLFNSIQGKIKWTKYMALALLVLAFSCAVILSYADGYMPRSQISILVISAFVFIGLSALFYLSHKLVKRNNA